MADQVLITMDDLEVAVQSNAAFESDGFRTAMVSADDNPRTVLRKSDPDLVVLTGGVHEESAVEIIRMARDRETPTLGILEETESDPPRHAAALGLTAWVQKPIDPEDVVAAGRRVIERRRLQQRTGITGESRAIQEVLVKLEQLSSVNSTVLIEGESGTGKELVAKAIHDLSSRREKPFIAVNCAALPETLLESELFGHEKGSFTGAAERRLGRFELAEGGTLFLDEVGEMPPAVQVKLLRVLESRQFYRVGGVQPIRVNVRVIAATNRRLKEEVATGNFRDDLYYRLNVLSVYLPPLRERKQDIPILVKRFVRELAAEHNRPFMGIAPEAMEILVNAQWPGNVRELRNLIESMVVLAPGREIRPADIPRDVREGGTRMLPIRMPGSGGEGHVGSQEMEFIFRSLVELKLQIEELRRRLDQRPEAIEVIEMGGESEDARQAVTLIDRGAIEYVDASDDEEEEEDESTAVLYRSGMTMAEVEKAAIEAALEETDGNRRQAARQLGIGERTLYRKIKEYGLS